LREAATSHGWTISDAIDIFELVPPESLLDESQRQSLLYSSDLELGETTNRIFVGDRGRDPQCGHQGARGVDQIASQLVGFSRYITDPPRRRP
jgi:hypothetical protein